MKTILHIIDTTGPGGAETVFIDLANRLATDRFRSIVLIRGKGWVYEELTRRGITPIILNAKGSFNWRYLLQVCRLIKEERVDIIQTHLLGSTVYGAIAGFLCRIPVVSTFHGAVDIGANERFKGLKFAAIRLGVKQVVAVSKVLCADIIGRTSLKEREIKIVYNGIRTADFHKARSNTIRQRYGWNEGHFLIGSLGNIRPAKGYDILLQAAALVRDIVPQVRFVIAGQPDKEGRLHQALLAQRQSLGLEQHVQFLGFLDDPAEYLANLDLFLSSSISEGLPLSAIQAMASELPLLATRCGGYEELVTHQQNGWLVGVGDPKALAEAILTLHGSNELRQRLASEARRHVESTYDVSVMVNDYTAIYDALLSRIQ